MERTMQTSRGASVANTDFRFSRFDPSWRDAEGNWPAGTWTDVSDFFSAGDLSEYEEVEGRYLDTISDCLGAGSAVVKAHRVELNHLSAAHLNKHDLAVDLPNSLSELRTYDDVRATAQACLRNQIWCELVSKSARIATGDDLYVRCRSTSATDALRMKRIAQHNGLFVDDIQYPEFEH